MKWIQLITCFVHSIIVELKRGISFLFSFQMNTFVAVGSQELCAMGLNNKKKIKRKKIFVVFPSIFIAISRPVQLPQGIKIKMQLKAFSFQWKKKQSWTSNRDKLKPLK